MKHLKRFVLVAVGIAMLGLAVLHTWTLEKQINVRSGELRDRHSALGILIRISNPKANVVSRTARRDGAGYEWLTVSTRSYSRQPCKEDWSTLFTCAGRLINKARTQEESQAFARSVLDELGESRSISKVARHAVMAYTGVAGSEPHAAILDLWEATGQGH